jgi:predicted 3-demethylubiquinone-9 3-methyltransferase (glyoxalase superfamily)
MAVNSLRLMEVHLFPSHKDSPFSVLCDTQEEIDIYWNKLTEGGQEVACGWLTDKFGLSWQITPKLLMQMISDSDPIKVQKAMAAMMTMIKINIAEIKRAWE